MGRAKAQEWCHRQGQTWLEAQGGVDFFGSPWSFKYVEPKDCCLLNIEWSICPHASLQEAEASGKATTPALHYAPNTGSSHSGFDHEHTEWDMVHKPGRVIPAPQVAMPKHYVPLNSPGRSIDRGLLQDAGRHVTAFRRIHANLFRNSTWIRLCQVVRPLLFLRQKPPAFCSAAAVSSYDSCFFPGLLMPW